MFSLLHRWRKKKDQQAKEDLETRTKYCLESLDRVVKFRIEEDTITDVYKENNYTIAHGRLVDIWMCLTFQRQYIEKLEKEVSDLKAFIKEEI